VVVEESFQTKTSSKDELKESSGEPPESTSSSTLESWVIKFEQSVNVLLTVNLLPFGLFCPLQFVYYDFLGSKELLASMMLLCYNVVLFFFS
jgi:hypothetical protein